MMARYDGDPEPRALANIAALRLLLQHRGMTLAPQADAQPLKERAWSWLRSASLLSSSSCGSLVAAAAAVRGDQTELSQHHGRVLRGLHVRLR